MGGKREILKYGGKSDVLKSWVEVGDSNWQLKDSPISKCDRNYPALIAKRVRYVAGQKTL